MVDEERLKKVCNNFSLLNEEQQNYVMGIIQALIFAKTTNNESEPAFGDSDNTER